MRIADFQIKQQASSHLSYREVKTEQLVIQEQTPGGEDLLTISDEGLKSLEASDKSSFTIRYSEEDMRKIELLEKFVSHILGRRFKFSFIASSDEEDLKSHKQSLTSKNHPKPIKQNRQGDELASAFRLTSTSYREESESLSFTSQGLVRTEDGSEIQFEVNLNFSRSYYEANEVNLTVGDFHDPIVLNLDGQGIAFSNHKLQLDLNMDGKIDEFRALTQGSGILVVDKNSSGQVEEASELVGAKTNNGFGELLQMDEDQNHWIDENDAAFKDLKLWIVSETGESKLLGLSEAGVGALYLGSVASDYHYKEGFDAYAKLKESSIYLKESGQAMMMHEVDFKI